MKRISVMLTEQQIAAIQTHAHTSGLKIGEIIRRAVDVYLAQVRMQSPPKK